MGISQRLAGVAGCIAALATGGCSLLLAFQGISDESPGHEDASPGAYPSDASDASSIGFLDAAFDAGRDAPAQAADARPSDDGSDASSPGAPDAASDVSRDAPGETADATAETGAGADGDGGMPPVYLGCFRDSPTRDLELMAYDSPVGTIETCLHACSVRGYLYAGVQGGSQCFCGNRFGGQGPAADCNEPCSGDPSESCGNGWENGVYSVQGTSPPAFASMYLGCYADNGLRDLPYAAYGSSNSTIETCAIACAYYGYAYAGAQAGSQCFCGEQFGAYGPANNCVSACTGDATEVCGGGYANSVYRTSAPLDAGPAADANAD